MDPDFGLLDIMRVNGTISWNEMEEVASQSSTFRRNALLLDYILAKDQSDGLIVALRDADQTHIANYLTANGEYSDDFGEDWPLTAKKIRILDTNHRSLVDLLELTYRLGLLCSSKVINCRQKDSISSKPTQHEKNNTLLGILRRRSLRDYQQTIKCLHASQQSHIADVLECGGVVVRVQASLEGVNVTEAENEISSAIANTIISDRSPEEASRILELVNLKVIAAKTGQSVVLYIYCTTIEDLQQLHESLNSVRFKDSVELCFNGLLTRSQKITVTALAASAEEFLMMRTYFKEEEISRRGLKRKNSSITELIENLKKMKLMASTTETDYQPSKTTLIQLPLELLDVILEKSFLHWILNPSSQQRDEDVVKALASVDFCWFQRIIRRRSKKRIWRRWKDFYGKTRKSSAIVRNNQTYLLDNIQSNYKLIASMLSFNCITEMQRHILQRQRSNCNDNKEKEQSHFIQQQRSNRDKNAEILHQMKSFDEAKFSNFVKCLRQTNQKTVARIMERGGGVMKVEVQTRGAKCTTSKEAQLLLHRNIEDLQNRTKPWSRQTDKLIGQLRDEGIEILHSHLDRQTVVVWIWCRSQSALEHIRKVYESNQLTDVLFGLANIPEIDKSKVINIDCNELEKAVVVCQISINFSQSINFRENDDVIGVIKLRNKIYVLCRSFSEDPHAIFVFEDRNPFSRQEEITVEKIIDPMDIGSSERENCLYVSDYKGKCVWKITIETDGEHKIIKWLTTDYSPRALSMSIDGRLLVVKSSSSSLLIYGSDAELIRSIQLPKDFGIIQCAVETSNGNFIIINYVEEKLEEVEEEEEEEEDEMEEDEEDEDEDEDEEECVEEQEGESGSSGRNPIKVAKEEEDEEEEEEEDGGTEGVEEKERESGSSGRRRRKAKRNFAVNEWTRDGQMVVRRFIPSNETQQPNCPSYLSIDSDDRVLVADTWNNRVILLDSDLKWNRIFCPAKEQEGGMTGRLDRFCYDEEKKQLIVGVHSSILEGAAVYTLSRK